MDLNKEGKQKNGEEKFCWLGFHKNESLVNKAQGTIRTRDVR